MDDQALFAALSFDRNPMHVDPVAARRLLTGLPVVHGIHVLMTALEQWEQAPRADPMQLECTFLNAINVGDEVVFEQKDEGDRLVVIEARVANLCCTRVRITVHATPDAKAGPSAAVGLDAPLVARLNAPLDQAPSEHVGQRYVLGVESTAELEACFPRLCERLGGVRASGLLALSYFVGMVCPGLHSIFATVSLHLGDPTVDASAIVLSVDQYDERFRRFQVSIAGALSGTLTAFLRPLPQQQLPIAQVARNVVTDEFKGTRSLVIGASRGLGELVAKILAAGGGDVLISYAHGRDDVERVDAEIKQWAHGRSEVHRIDVTARRFDGIDFVALDAVYFFATPRIYRKKAGVFVGALFLEFVDFYINSLYALCQHIEAQPLDKKIRVYVPSSEFVSERPDGLVEYAMAKAAVEVLIADINRHFKRVGVFTTRLRRLSTDQTSSVLKVSIGDNLAALLPVVRAMQAPQPRP